jgi:hypothetical protein
MRSPEVAAQAITMAYVEVHKSVHRLDEKVIMGRKAGLTWTEIADLLEMTRQAAWQAYHHLCEPVS